MMNDPQPSAEGNRRQADAIADVIQRTADVDWAPGALLVSFVVVADWIGPDGERHLSRIGPDRQPAWITDGLLAAGATVGWDL